MFLYTQSVTLIIPPRDLKKYEELIMMLMRRDCWLTSLLARLSSFLNELYNQNR
jgi:hypothetical protein